MIIPAIIGGAALLADGVLTPAVTVTTAIEGLRGIPMFYDHFGNDQSIIVWITLTILFVLLACNALGQNSLGKHLDRSCLVGLLFGDRRFDQLFR